MKPSEYLLKPNGKYNLFSYHNMNLVDNIDDYYNPKYSEQEYDDACKYKDKLLENIDKRFIDKEELKEKIHKNSKCLNIDTEYYNGYREAVNNILKLLESEDK